MTRTTAWPRPMEPTGASKDLVSLVSFDGTEQCRASLVTPNRYRDLQRLLSGPGPFAVRGAGVSYCQASAADGVTTISTDSFDRFLAFDPDRLHLTVESGVTVGQLVRFAVGRSTWFPVLPGHPAITVGGCVAFNVHGKSQHDVGCFSDHVESLTLIHPDHGELACSRHEHGSVFDLTLGGMGLTGYIATVTLRLQPLPGRSICRAAHRVGSLTEAVELMLALGAGDGTGGTLYSWNDLNRTGPRFGQGFVYAESFEDVVPPRHCVSYRSLAPTRRRGPSVAGVRFAARLVNAGYSSRERLRPRRLVSVENATFPINGNEAYYRLFGRRGFREYQMLIPGCAWGSAAREIQVLVAAAGVPVNLGSLKLFRGERRLLWFRGDGICLAIDAAASDRTRWLFEQLDRVAIDHGALVNLSKDSRLNATTVRRLYSGYEEFRTRLSDYDPKRRLDSMLRRRIDV
jgi:decaprenylphospho-beta-D-ribofuranose 2-oxidase